MVGIDARIVFLPIETRFHSNLSINYDTALRIYDCVRVWRRLISMQLAATPTDTRTHTSTHAEQM